MISILLCATGAHLGLFLGFRGCMRVRSWRDSLIPLLLLGWCLTTYPLHDLGLLYLALQTLAASGLLTWARRSSIRALAG